MHQSFVGLCLLLFTSVVTAHGGVIGYTIEGKRYNTAKVGSGQNRLKATPQGGGNIQRVWTGLGPVKTSASPNIACNTPGTPAKTSATIRAGGNITAYWNPWPHDGGPLAVWMVECPRDCSSFTNPHTAKWFKIHEDGLSGTQKLVRSGNSLSVRVPSSLKPGNYLIRHELINLARPPAEFYPECAQLRVTGSGSTSPGPANRATLGGAYKMSLPQLSQSYNTWKSKASSYKLPGPPVWKG